ncbi:hypothetical protein GF312_12990 [Candidatus Poribacteria bacterium]|nr:hypothetical protein [Candidatus Poribacteria bacterium]
MICILSITGVIYSQLKIDQIRLPRKRLEEKIIYIPTGRFMKAASIGFHAVLSDLLWTRAVLYFGEHFTTDREYPWLYRILDAVTTMDPHNILAYRFGGNLLALEGNRIEESIALLKKGIKHNPDKDWRLYFLLGFNYYYILNDHLTAAYYFEQAVKLPGHPEYLPKLVARMYAKADKEDVAIEFLEEIYTQYNDEQVKQTIMDRLILLKAKEQAKEIQKLVERYKQIYNEYPENFEALVNKGLINRIPEYPGGYFTLNPEDGTVDWFSENTPNWP